MGWNVIFWTQPRTLLKGQTLTEYALIMLFVGIAAFSAYLGVGRSINAVTEVLTTSLNAAINGM